MVHNKNTLAYHTVNNSNKSSPNNEQLQQTLLNPLNRLHSYRLAPSLARKYGTRLTNPLAYYMAILSAYVGISKLPFGLNTNLYLDTVYIFNTVKLDHCL
jgi:hypothetical protein